MNKTKTFPLDEVLSITTGMLVAKRHMQAVYDVVSFLYQGPIFTATLARLADPSKDAVLKQYPELNQVTEDDNKQLEASLIGRNDEDDRKRVADNWVILVQHKYNLKDEYSIVPIN